MRDFKTLVRDAIREREVELALTHRADLAAGIRTEIVNLSSHLINLPAILDNQTLDKQSGPELIRYLADLRPGTELTIGTIR